MKDHIRNLLQNEQFEDIATRAADRKRVLGVLVSLTFDADATIAWRAVEALGLAADRVADASPDAVRSQLRRLHWFMSDESGAVCWYAPQSMAEIVRHRPDTFAEYVDIVLSLIRTTEQEDLGHFRAAILWAIGRVAPVARDRMSDVVADVAECLDHEDSQVRGLAVWCLKQAGREDLFAGRDRLQTDDGPVEIYVNHRLEKTSVRDLLGS